MDVLIREYKNEDIQAMTAIWNEIVEEGIAFPQEDILTEAAATEFFAGQTYTGVAADNETGEIYGLYILHPNNIGRCGHIANSSYAVRSDVRGQKIGKALVADSLEKAKEKSFRVLQLNAVVRTNSAARFLYVNMGFIPMGTIFGGFRMKDGTYEDVVPYFYTLEK